MTPAEDVPTLSERGPIIEIRTTFARREDAAACAGRLVAERLAACVQIDGPITSVYRWQGTVETGEEYRCTCKTSPERAAACAAAILAGHPYENPELIVVAASAPAPYADWVQASVTAGP